MRAMHSLDQTRRCFVSMLAALAVFISGTSFVSSQPNGRQNAAPKARPRLVLLIVVDQFRYDYLDRFGDLFGMNGLRRLRQQGASWVNSSYDHFPTYTAPGHATMMTGAYPAETGIIANEWIEREPGKEFGRKVSSVSDDAAKLCGGDPAERAASPHRLMTSTVGDELRLADDRTKVIGISLKDRSAILPAGRHANAAYWFSARSGAMVSSSFYAPCEQLPKWVSDFNGQHPAERYQENGVAVWNRLLSDDAEYKRRAGPIDDPKWEDIGKVDGETNKFPHKFTGSGSNYYSALEYSPFYNDMLVKFAEQAITNENLGADDTTDLLTLSLSANDYVGHRFGPYSWEAMDVTLRVDQQIGELLDFVNGRIGLQNTMVVFSADHGVAPIPEHAAAMNLINGSGRVQNKDLLTAIRNAISARYNTQKSASDPTADYIVQYDDNSKTRLKDTLNALLKDSGAKEEVKEKARRLLEKIEKLAGGLPDDVLTEAKDVLQGKLAGVLGYALVNGNLYFNLEALKRDGVNLEEIEKLSCRAALTVAGIARCFTRAQLLQGAVSSSDPIERRVVHGFYPRRNGDVIVILEPFKYLIEYVITATHGSPYSYDTHVPLIIMGNGLKPDRYYQAATPADIAPTLSAVLRVQPPSNVVGRVLIEALDH